MIKEIEVGGVKHSITLADDMVGTGLKKNENGTVDIKIPIMIPQNSPLMSGILVNSEFGLCLDRSIIAKGLSGTGLEVERGYLRVSTGLADDSLFLNALALNLSGTGLIAEGGKLAVSGGGSVDVDSLCGSGLEVQDGKLALSTDIAGSGLSIEGGPRKINVDYNKLVDPYEGLKVASSGLGVNVGSGLSKDPTCGKLMIDYENLFDLDSLRIIHGPIHSVGVRVTSGLEINPGNGLKVKISERSSGLRLFLNSKGELDVTQD